MNHVIYSYNNWIGVTDEGMKAHEQANRKYVQWHRIDHLARCMQEEVDRRCEGQKAIYWLDCSAVRLDRMIARMRRALDGVECPDYVGYHDAVRV